MESLRHCYCPLAGEDAMLTYRTAARHSEPQPREAYLAKRRKALYASGGFSDRLVPQRLSWLHSEQIPLKKAVQVYCVQP
jgi:hypothetical protein